MTAREGNVGNCHPEKIHCRPTQSQGWQWFSRGDNFQHYPLVQSIIIIITRVYWMLIKYITSGFKTMQVKWIFVLVFCILYIQTTPVRISGELYAHKFCAVDIFWNITRHQAISPIAKFHHSFGSGLIIQRVILILSIVSELIIINFIWKYNICTFGTGDLISSWLLLWDEELWELLDLGDSATFSNSALFGDPLLLSTRVSNFCCRICDNQFSFWGLFSLSLCL